MYNNAIVVGLLGLVYSGAATKCYTCDGVGTTVEAESNFFDLSNRPEAETIEKDDSTVEMDMCNDLKIGLPAHMLTECPNADDICFIEKTSGRMEQAIEAAGEEDIVAMTSTQITRGCKSKDDLPDAFPEFEVDAKSGVPIRQDVPVAGRPMLLTEEVCEDVETRGLTGKKCITICTQDGCNSSGSLVVGLAVMVVMLVAF